MIYENIKKEKRVMIHKEIHKFCDATLKSVLEMLKKYNKHVKYGYANPSPSYANVEYLQFYEEDIEERLRHRDQMRRWEIKMTTLAEHIIVAGAENRPPMLEKSMYDSWTSLIRLFIKGKKNGRMMLDSIDNGPLVYLTVEENRQTRPKKYPEITEAQQLQDDCDVKATNLILHGLPPDVYALLNHQEAAKDIWDRVKLLIKGTELSYQEHECKLYNLFDKFAYVQGETLYEYYWRFSQLINDMHAIGITMQQVQFNTKFLNALLSKWSKFVTDVKLAKSLYTSNYDQLYAYLSQHEQHANKAWIMREIYLDPLALVANSQTLYNPSQSPQHSLEFPQSDSGLAVPTFQQGDDPIECINKAMAFLSAVASRFPPLNNQLRTSSNPKNQATIQDGIATTLRGNYAAAQQTILQILAFQIEDLDVYDSDCDDISSAKVVLMENLSSCDPGVLSEVPYSDSYLNDMINQDVQEMQYSEQTNIDDYLDNEINSDSNIIPYSQYLQESQDAEKESLLKTLTVSKTKSKEKESKYIDKEIVLEKQNKELENIICKMYRSTQAMHMLMKPQVFYDDTHKQALGYQNPFNLKKAQQIKPTLYDGSVIAKEHALISVINDEETLILEEVSRSKMLDKQNDLILIKQKVTISLIDYSTLNKIKEDFGKRFFTQKELSAEQAFWLKHSNYNPDTSFKSHTAIRIEAPSELPKKLVSVTHMNKDTKVRVAKPVTSSSNNPKQSDSLKTKDSNKPLLTSTGVDTTTSASGSKPLGNTKKNRISQPPSSNQKNKVEENPRKVKYSLNKRNSISEPICNAHVKHSVKDAKFESIFAICNKCLFDANHDMTFTIDGNRYPLTKITSTKVVPTKETSTKLVATPTQRILVYSRRPKATRSVGCPNCSVAFGLWMLQAYDRKSLSTHQLQTPPLVIPLGVEEADYDIKFAHMDNNPYVGFAIPEPSSEESSTQELVPRPDHVMIITLKLIYKVKLDELGGVSKNKARLVARGYRQEEGLDFEEYFALVA
ncbi:retrovirus-related pol polyprotein from transposon TNT 1-94 [Tanacetum coccineum]